MEPRDPGFTTTGLRVPSTLQLHRLMTVSTALIRRQLGHLSPELQARIAEGLPRKTSRRTNPASL
jgi:mRNA interferase MazF